MSRKVYKNIEIESNYRWCPIEKYRVHKNICGNRCKKYNCPIYREILKKDKVRELKKKKKKFEEEGITRSLLLKPEDRINGDKE